MYPEEDKKYGLAEGERRNRRQSNRNRPINRRTNEGSSRPIEEEGKGEIQQTKEYLSFYLRTNEVAAPGENSDMFYSTMIPQHRNNSDVRDDYSYGQFNESNSQKNRRPSEERETRGNRNRRDDKRRNRRDRDRDRQNRPREANMEKTSLKDEDLYSSWIQNITYEIPMPSFGCHLVKVDDNVQNRKVSNYKSQFNNDAQNHSLPGIAIVIPVDLFFNSNIKTKEDVINILKEGITSSNKRQSRK